MKLNLRNGTTINIPFGGSLCGLKVISYELSEKDLRDILDSHPVILKEVIEQMWQRTA